MEANGEKRERENGREGGGERKRGRENESEEERNHNKPSKKRYYPGVLAALRPSVRPSSPAGVAISFPAGESSGRRRRRGVPRCIWGAGKVSELSEKGRDAEPGHSE